MPAPTNTTAETAIDLGTLPVVDLQQDVNFGGVTYTVWYKYTATANGLLAIWGFGDLGTYKPRLKIFTPDGVTASPVATSVNKVAQTVINKDQTYYFRFESSTGNVSPAILIINAKLVDVAASIPSGSIAVPDDTLNLPLIIASPSDGTVQQYVNPFPAGGQSEVLDNGILLAEDNSGEASNLIRLSLRSAQFAEIALIEFAMPNSGWQTTYIRGNRTNKFYIAWAFDYDNNPDGFSTFLTITSAGVTGSPVNLGVSPLKGLAPNIAETILYFGQGGGAHPVKRWDIAGGALLSDLNAGIANYQLQGDILVFPDDTIAVTYKDSTTSNRKVVLFSSAGAVLNTYDYGINDIRLAYDINSAYCWVWLGGTLAGGNLGQSTFLLINPADGSVITTLSNYLFDTGVYEGAATATPPSYFGVSGDPGNSGFFIIREATVVAGIYKIVPGSGKTNDTLWQPGGGGGGGGGIGTLDVEIPEPMIRTALLGD